MKIRTGIALVALLVAGVAASAQDRPKRPRTKQAALIIEPGHAPAVNLQAGGTDANVHIY